MHNQLCGKGNLRGVRHRFCKSAGRGLCQNSEPARNCDPRALRRQDFHVRRPRRLGLLGGQTNAVDAAHRRKFGRRQDRGIPFFPRRSSKPSVNGASRPRASTIRRFACSREPTPDSPRSICTLMRRDCWSGLCVLWTPPVGRVPTQIDYSDYRDVSGVKMPFRWITTWTGGKTTTELTELRANVAIDAARFGRPAPAPPAKSQ